MESAEGPADGAGGDSGLRSPISVAILAAVACVPIVIAAGFLADRSPRNATTAALPGDISALALRGPFDAAADRRAPMPARAGY